MVDFICKLLLSTWEIATPECHACAVLNIIAKHDGNKKNCIHKGTSEITMTTFIDICIIMIFAIAIYTITPDQIYSNYLVFLFSCV